MLTGTENLVMIARLLEMPRREAKARAAELLERFELWDARDRTSGVVGHLKGSQQPDPHEPILPCLSPPLGCTR